MRFDGAADRRPARPRAHAPRHGAQLPAAAAVHELTRRRQPAGAAALHRQCAAGPRRSARRARRALRRAARRWSGSPTRRTQLPRDLTQVEMRKLELARAMAAEPKLLIADESMAGLSHSEVDDIVGAADPAQRARHHHHPDRAHHARGDELLAAAGRAGLRQEDRRRQARRRSSAIPRWRGRILANSLTIEKHRRRLRRGARARGRLAQRRLRARPWCCSAPTATASRR